MTNRDKRKQSLYFPAAMLTEIKAEAARTGLSISAVVQKAWSEAKATIKTYPSSD